MTYVRVADLKSSDRRQNVVPNAGARRGRRNADLSDAENTRRGYCDRREGAATWPGAFRSPHSASSSSASCPKGCPSCFRRCEKPGSRPITQAPIDRLAAPERALEALADAGLQLARLTVNDTPEREWTAVCREVAALQTRLGVDSRVCAAGAHDRCDAADDRLRRRKAHRDFAAAGRQRRDHSGRLGAVRPEAGAGGADVRRRRHRLGCRRRRRVAGAPPFAGRRNPPEHSGRRLRAGRTGRPRSDGATRRCRSVSEPSATSTRVRSCYGPRAARRDRFSLRFDVPARCAELLHANEVDLGLIPSIEYPGHDYRIVPGVSIASDGPVASVAIFSKVPTEDIRSIALDTSSRTSHGAAARAVRAMVRDRAATREHAARSRRG